MYYLGRADPELGGGEKSVVSVLLFVSIDQVLVLTGLTSALHRRVIITFFLCNSRGSDDAAIAQTALSYGGMSAIRSWVNLVLTCASEIPHELKWCAGWKYRNLWKCGQKSVGNF